MLLISLFFIALSSCSKDRRYSNKLEGSWVLISKELAGVEADLSGLLIVLEFGDCKNGTDNCFGMYRQKTINPDNSATQVVIPIETHVTDRGKRLNINYNNGAIFEKYDILELNRKSLVIQYENQGAVYTFEMLE